MARIILADKEVKSVSFGNVMLDDSTSKYFGVTPIIYSEGLTYSLNEDNETYSVTGIGTCTDIDLNIPPLYNGKKITKIADNAFSDCSSLKTVKMSDYIISIGDHAFGGTWGFGGGCTSLVDITLSNNLISIGEQAFFNCHSLTTNIILQDSLLSVGFRAFCSCTEITSIVLPKSITSIGSNALADCNKLESIYYTGTSEEFALLGITVPAVSTVYYNYGKDFIITLDPNGGTISTNTVNVKKYFDFSLLDPSVIASKDNYQFDGWYYNDTLITSGQFTYDTNITLVAHFKEFAGTYSINNNKVTITGYNGNGAFLGIPAVLDNKPVTSIGYRAFFRKSLISITIPNSVTSIGEGAFYNCTFLTSITIPNSVISIGDDAFKNCTSLASIIIPNSVTSIGDYAFSGCSGLTSITIPDSVTSIGSNAFYGCSNLINIIIGNNITAISWLVNLANNLSSYKTIIINSNNMAYDSRGNCNAIIETSTNTLIAGCQNTVIPNSITSIGRNAFYGCNSLAGISIPNSVTSIGEKAFSNCTSLTSITIPNSVISIDNYAFSSCTSLGSITIGNNVTSIGNYAFSHCSSLTSITIPNSVTSIGSWAFSNCTSLTSLTIGSGLTSISSFVSSECGNLTSIIIDESNSVYDSRDNCNAIIKTSTNTLVMGCQNTVIPNSVTNIGRYAFYACNLTSITIPNSVTSIGEGAFNSCVNLTSITIPNSVTSIGDYAFSGCSGLTSITIPDSVTSIAYGTFFGCNSLDDITIYYPGYYSNLTTDQTYLNNVLSSLHDTFGDNQQVTIIDQNSETNTTTLGELFAGGGGSGSGAGSGSGSGSGFDPAVTDTFYLDNSSEISYSDSLYNETKYYQLEVSEAGYYYMYLSSNESSCGILYDAEGYEVTYDSGSHPDGNDFCINWYLDSDYTYYLAVKEINGGEIDSYTLYIDTTGPSQE